MLVKYHNDICDTQSCKFLVPLESISLCLYSDAHIYRYRETDSIGTRKLLMQLQCILFLSLPTKLDAHFFNYGMKVGLFQIFKFDKLSVFHRNQGSLLRDLQ